MTRPRRARRLAATAFLSAGVLVASAACGGGGGDDTSEGGKITLTVDTFGTFGYEQLYKQYEKAHPNIKIQPRNITRLEDYTPRMNQYLAAGTGAGDAIAIEEGVVLSYLAQADKFVDLRQYGADSLKGNFLPWKYQQGSTADGKVIGLGTDIGGMGLCYRADLFEKAGLPTDREEVGKLWSTWDEFEQVGKDFAAKNTGAKFMDGSTNVYNTILMQEAGKTSNQTYFDRQNNFIMASNPAIKTAWDRAVSMSKAGLTAKLETFTDEWSAGLQKAAFATVTCPAWMLGLIKEQAGDSAEGKWDIAAVPGGGGSWGGSWMGVPASSKHPKEAADLVKFLTSPQGQIAAFKAANNLPSSPQALDDAAVKAFKNPYFSDAPVGEIYGTGAKTLKPVFLGEKNQPVRENVEDALRAVEAGELAPGAGWQRALKDGEREAK